VWEYDIFRRDALDASAYGIVGAGLDGFIMRHILLDNLGRGIKVGSGALSTNLLFQFIESFDCHQTLFLSDVDGVTIEDSVFRVVEKDGSKPHAYYAERVKNELVRRVDMFGHTPGQVAHWYADSGGGSNTLVEDCAFENSLAGAAVIHGREGFTMRRTTLRSASGPALKVYDNCTDVLLEHVDAYGDSFLGGSGADIPHYRFCSHNGIVIPDRMP
jgi:hypothetical protein